MGHANRLAYLFGCPGFDVLARRSLWNCGCWSDPLRHRCFVGLAKSIRISKGTRLNDFLSYTSTKQMRKVRVFVGIAFFTTLLSCGGDNSIHLVHLSASPDTINDGDTTTLSWTSPSGATVLSSDFGASSATGSTSVSPTSSTTYNIKVRLATNDIVSESTTVTVNPVSTEEKRREN